MPSTVSQYWVFHQSKRFELWVQVSDFPYNTKTKEPFFLADESWRSTYRVKGLLTLHQNPRKRIGVTLTVFEISPFEIRMGDKCLMSHALNFDDIANPETQKIFPWHGLQNGRFSFPNKGETKKIASLWEDPKRTPPHTPIRLNVCVCMCVGYGKQVWCFAMCCVWCRWSFTSLVVVSHWF